MAHGLKIMILSLCISSAVMFTAYAQQTQANNNLNGAQIQLLRQEMKGLQKQLRPLRSQMQQLLTQIKALREQMLPLEDKLRNDGRQMQALMETAK